MLEDEGKPKHRALMESFVRNSRMVESNTTLSAIFRNVTRICTSYHPELSHGREGIR